jgi:hypothetical protein
MGKKSKKISLKATPTNPDDESAIIENNTVNEPSEQEEQRTTEADLALEVRENIPIGLEYVFLT